MSVDKKPDDVSANETKKENLTPYAEACAMKQCNVDQGEAESIVKKLGKAKTNALIQAGQNGEVATCREILGLTD